MLWKPRTALAWLQSVAKVASVAVANAQKLKNDNSGDTNSLTANEENRILAWLASIDETDPAMIAETLQSCRRDAETLAYFLGRAAEVPPLEASKPIQMITCRGCSHFLSHNAHGRGAGICQAGLMTSGAALWSETQHQCDQHEAACHDANLYGRAIIYR